MTTTNISTGNTSGLPQTLRVAQEAIHLPEVRAGAATASSACEMVHGGAPGETRRAGKHTMNR